MNKKKTVKTQRKGRRVNAQLNRGGLSTSAWTFTGQYDCASTVWFIKTQLPQRDHDPHRCTQQTLFFQFLQLFYLLQIVLWTSAISLQKLVFFSLSFCRITVATSPYNPSPSLQDRQCNDALPWNIVVEGLGRQFALDKGTSGLHYSTLIDGLRVRLIVFVAFFYIHHRCTNPVCCRLNTCVYVHMFQ